MFKKPLKLLLSSFLVFGLFIFASADGNANVNSDVENTKQSPPNEIENYLMGKFNPRKHNAFVKVPERYANRKGYYLRESTLEAFKKMHEAARKDGVKLIIRSATRNFDSQKRIWERKWRAQKKSRSSVDKARNILQENSMPGSSRHHWGTEIDLNAFKNDWFEYDQGLKLFRWMNKNAAKYGFHRPYTKKDDNGVDCYPSVYQHRCCGRAGAANGCGAAVYQRGSNLADYIYGVRRHTVEHFAAKG